MKRKLVVGVLFLGLVGTTATPQAPEDAPPTRRSARSMEVRVDVSRFQGDEKLASLPYTLALLDDGGSGSGRVRMGIDVPIRVKQDSGEIQYRGVGTNIDCTAVRGHEGHYRLTCSVEQSSLYDPRAEEEPPGASPALSSVPVLRTFRASGNLMLRDGESGLMNSAADPVSGERIDVRVTLRVLP